MLFEKSKYVEGDIISLKLISGDEIIGKYIIEDLSTVTIKKPVMIAITKNGPALAPIMMTVEPDKDFTINKSSIIFQGNTVQDIADQYIYQTTGIQPVSKGSIIT